MKNIFQGGHNVVRVPGSFIQEFRIETYTQFVWPVNYHHIADPFSRLHDWGSVAFLLTLDIRIKVKIYFTGHRFHWCSEYITVCAY